MPLSLSQDGEGGVGGGVHPSQLLQGLAVLLQPLRGGLEAVGEGQRGEGGGRGQFGLREVGEGSTEGKRCLNVITTPLHLFTMMLKDPFTKLPGWIFAF